jgi:hypothetical protein
MCKALIEARRSVSMCALKRELKRALKLYIEALDISKRVAPRACQHSREQVSTEASTQARPTRTAQRCIHCRFVSIHDSFIKVE